MKRILFVALMMGVVNGIILAEPVGENAARAIAAQFMAKKKLGTISTAPPKKLRGATTSTPAIYVFNTEKTGCGWVIVSGDDRTQQVLGYNDCGSYDESNVPHNMQWWLSQYVEEIASLDESENNDLPVLGSFESNNYNDPPKVDALSPLIQTKWNQGYPYNFQCPMIGSISCVTGCVATAMAQVMYYHQWPQTTSKTIPSYYWQNGRTTLEPLDTTSFDWNAMKKTYNSDDTSPTDSANAAVARLMRYCGQAVRINYGKLNTGGSGGNHYCEVWPEYFRYSTKARKLFRSDYSFSQWTSFILSELQANRPVIYTGLEYNTGHSFICDGYDGNGYFHFNWGWSGNKDGYFLLTSLNPNATSTGGTMSTNGYVMRQEILIGLEPDTVSTTEKNSVTACSRVYVGSETYTRNSSSDPFVIEVTASFENKSPLLKSYDLGWGIYDADGHTLLQLSSPTVNGQPIFAFGATTITKTLNFGKDYPDGLYYLRPVSRQSGSTSWLPCHYSGVAYVCAHINGNNLTLLPRNAGKTNGVTASIESCGTVRKVNRPLEVNVGVANTTFTDNIPFYLFENSTLVGANSLNLGKDCDGTLVINYTPSTPGTKTLKITADKDGANVYCTGSVTINPMSAGNISMSYSLLGGDASINDTVIVGSSSLPFTVSIQNHSTDVYNDFIVARLYKRSNEDNVLVSTIANPFNITGGSSAVGNFAFNNLEPGDYVAKFYYYNYDTLIQALDTDTYHVVIKGDVNGDGVVSSVDVTALYNYLLNNNSSSIAGGDVDGDGIITSVDITIIYNILLSD